MLLAPALGWVALYALCLGGSAFLVVHPGLLEETLANRLPPGQARAIALWVVGAFVFLLATHAVAIFTSRGRAEPPSLLSVVADLHRRLRLCLAVPFLPALMSPGIEKDSPKETLAWIAFATVAIGAGVYGSSDARAVDPDSDAAPESSGLLADRLSASIAVGLLVLAYAIYFSRLSITNHHALNTRTTDLGYYDNIFWQSSHGHPLGCSFIKAGYHGSAHFDPILVLLSPLHYLYPRAELLLVLQSTWLALGAIPAYLVAAEKLRGRRAGVVFALLYLLHPALQGANLYEFHSLTLLTPVLLWALYFLEVGAIKRYAGALFLALLVREDVALLACFVGLYAIVTRRPGFARVGLFTILGSLAYFGVVKAFFMTSSDIFMSGKDSYSFAYYYEDLIPNHDGMRGLLFSLVASPIFTLRTMLAEPKLIYLATVFAPLLFLPFLARKGRLMLAYGLVFTLLASRAPVFSTHFQYSSVLLPVAFAIAPSGLARVLDSGLVAARGLNPQALRRALLAAALTAGLLVSWKLGGVLPNASFRGGFNHVRYRLLPGDVPKYEWVRAQADAIPPSASVAVSNRMGPHVSARRVAVFFPPKDPTDFVLVDEAELKTADLEALHDQEASGELVLVSQLDDFGFYKRR